MDWADGAEPVGFSGVDGTPMVVRPDGDGVESPIGTGSVSAGGTDDRSTTEGDGSSPEGADVVGASPG